MNYRDMPGEEKLARCPKGERRDKKTKKCVKVGKAKSLSPKKSPPKNTRKSLSPMKSSPKNTRKSLSPKKSSIKIDIPYMSSMKDLNEYMKDYIEFLLIEMSNIIVGKSPTGNSKNPTYYYVNEYQLKMFIQEEIKNITNNHESRGYSFTSKQVKVLISQLQRLLTYVEHIANKKGHVDTNKIAELYRN